MANGDYLTGQELDILSKPIMDIKSDIDFWAKSNELEVVYNDRGWAHVKLKWSNVKSLNCAIHFSLNDNKSDFGMAVGATKYNKNEYYYRFETMIKKVTPPFNSNIIIEAMKKGMMICNSWSIEDLEIDERKKPNSKKREGAS